MCRMFAGVTFLLLAAGWGCGPEFAAFFPDEGIPGADGSGGDNSSDDSTGGAIGDGLTVSGRLTPGGLGKHRPSAQDAPAVYGQVVAVSSTTFEVYEATPGDDGSFSFEFPPDEHGNIFQFALIGADGRVAGPILLGADGPAGFTGLTLGGSVEMGDIGVPENPALEPIGPTDNSGFANQIAGDVSAWVNDAGVPIGVPSVGKGAGTQTGSPSATNVLDQDQDGLIDPFDADDNGNGIVDDFDPTPGLGIGKLEGVDVNLFMNLKLDDATANVFYASDDAGVQEILNTRTVITFEVRGTGTRRITGARVLDWPAPAPWYLKEMTTGMSGGGGRWADAGYEFLPDGDNHFQQWATPNAPIYAGDLFTIEVTFDDGTSARCTRMINFVFHSIPKLVQYGPAASLGAYASVGALTLDGTQDLVLDWVPPYDDMGDPLTGFTYFFEIFYNDSSGHQIQGIDGAATWLSAIPQFDANRRVYEVSGGDLALLSADGTLSATLPLEIFADTVETTTGPVGVSSYKIDIAAQKNGNNAALMLPASK